MREICASASHDLAIILPSGHNISLNYASPISGNFSDGLLGYLLDIDVWYSKMSALLKHLDGDYVRVHG